MTLDEPYRYEIRIPGSIDPGWHEWVSAELIEETMREWGRVTIIDGDFDQAALHGILRRIYSLGYPLIGVTCLDAPKDR